MTYQEANHISIKDYLKSLGILPQSINIITACTTVRSVRWYAQFQGGLRCKSVV